MGQWAKDTECVGGCISGWDKGGWGVGEGRRAVWITDKERLVGWEWDNGQKDPMTGWVGGITDMEKRVG